MKKIVKKLVVTQCLILLAASAQAADTFTVDGRDVIVSPPEGFSLVTDEMTEPGRLLPQPPEIKKEILAYYISEIDVAAVMAGNLPEIDRWFVLKNNNLLPNGKMGKSDFSKFKMMMKSKYQERLERAKAQASGNLNDGSQGVAQQLDSYFVGSAFPAELLDFYYESENAVGFSMQTGRGINSDSKSEVIGRSVTVTFLNASGTVLCLAGFGPHDELDWTRSASISWAESVIASNSPPPQDSTDVPVSNGMETLGTGLLGTGLLGNLGIVGGLIALCTGMVAQFYRMAP